MIAVEPLSQVAPTTSEAECSTNSTDLNFSQSESAPQLILIHDSSVPEVASTSVTEHSSSEPQLPALR